jgi:hypothetical protein
MAEAVKVLADPVKKQQEQLAVEKAIAEVKDTMRQMAGEGVTNVGLGLGCNDADIHMP